MCSTRSRRRSGPRHHRSHSSRPLSRRRPRDGAIPPSPSTHRSMPTPAPAWRPRTPRPAPAASRSCSIRWIDASPIPSSTARTADLASRSSPRCRTTEGTRRCVGSRCVRTVAAEYEDPADRRYHAEPIACPTCGPRLQLVDRAGQPIAGDPVVHAAALLRSGSIVAVKGLGGFQLACDGLDDRVVRELRTRKRRPDKPFAVMVRDLDEVRRRFDPSLAAEAALGSWRAPIVLVDDRGTLAPAVAPGHRRHGAMLPSTPVHHLLVRPRGSRSS